MSNDQGSFTRDYGLLTGKTGRVTVNAQFATRDNALGTGPEYASPQQVTLLVTRRLASLPRAKWPGQFAGDILTVIVEDFGWGEYGHEGHCGDNHWLSENYRMQILSLVEPPKQDYGLLTNVTGQVAASVRRIRYDDESHRSGVDMGMVDVVTLMVTRRLASLPNAQRAGEFAGDILSVTVGHDGWIEYDHKSYQGHTAPELANHWLREHHWMLILSVTPSPTEEPAGWGRMHG